MNRSWLVERIRGYLQDDDQVLTVGDLDAVLTAALAQYSRRSPRRISQEYAGDSSTVSLTLPTYWETSFSRLLRAEYVYATQIPIRLGRDQVWVEDTTSGQKIRVASAVASGQTLRLTYEGRHTATATACTVSTGDHEALAMLGASLAADLLASHYAAQGDSSLSADTVNHQGRSTNFESRAKRLHDLYEKAVPAQTHHSTLEVVRS
jgi:hypothetical protein